MLTAEQWYQHQENYVKYGIDMSPPIQRKQTPAKAVNKVFGIRDKAKLFMLLMAMGFLCIAVVIAAAYASQIKYNINAITRENAVIQGEIENLDVSIEAANNIRTIEERAINELGMVYPVYEQIVFIAAKTEKFNDFAMSLREQAYN
jgi:cell division protein FtsL